MTAIVAMDIYQLKLLKIKLFNYEHFVVMLPEFISNDRIVALQIGGATWLSVQNVDF